MSNSEYYDAIDMPGMNPDEDRTSSEDFSSEDEGEADSIHSEVSEQPKFGQFSHFDILYCSTPDIEVALFPISPVSRYRTRVSHRQSETAMLF